MKYQYMPFVISTLISCGAVQTNPIPTQTPIVEPTSIPSPTPNLGCTTKPTLEGVAIICGTSDPVVIKNGKDGTTVVGPQGVSGSQGNEGSQGSRGSVGETGAQGVKGSSCSINQLANGAIITCTDGTMATILNGTQGVQGDTGTQGDTGAQGSQGAQGSAGSDAPQSAFQIIQVIDPCGTQPGFNEVLLKTADGHLLAHYADGTKQFLTLLTPNSYVTTDFTPCYFIVNSDYSISGEHL